MTVTTAELPATLQRLKDEGYTRFVDLTAVDRPDQPERFELNYVLYHMERHEWERVKATTAASAPTVSQVFTGANAYEREVFDLFGVVFEGHPDLRRILMWDEFKDHPMRKDYKEPDDYEWEPTPHGVVHEKAKAHYPTETAAEVALSAAKTEGPKS